MAHHTAPSNKECATFSVQQLGAISLGVCVVGTLVLSSLCCLLCNLFHHLQVVSELSVIFSLVLAELWVGVVLVVSVSEEESLRWRYGFCLSK